MKFRNMAAINPQRPEALVETSSSVLMADAARVAFETHLMNSLSTGINVCLGATNARTKKRHGKLRICMGRIFEYRFVAVLGPGSFAETKPPTRGGFGVLIKTA